MSKFIKNPIVIEAVRFEGFKDSKGAAIFSERPEWLVAAFGKDIIFFDKPNTLTIKTSEGDMTASEGDYIIREPFDKERPIYPCKPDIFKETYSEYIEPADVEFEEEVEIDLSWPEASRVLKRPSLPENLGGTEYPAIRRMSWPEGMRVERVSGAMLVKEDGKSDRNFVPSIDDKNALDWIVVK